MFMGRALLQQDGAFNSGDPSQPGVCTLRVIRVLFLKCLLVVVLAYINAKEMLFEPLGNAENSTRASELDFG